MKPEKIVLDGMVITIYQDKGRVNVHAQKGVFSFIETMTRDQSQNLRWALQMAEDDAGFYRDEQGNRV